VALRDELVRREQIIVGAIDEGDYRRAFGEAAKFGPSVDRFFTDVFVMVDDQALREARLGLMKRLEALILKLGDISEIVAEKQA
jgi:glycyl-tRNA synthetase beta chain